MGCICSSSLPKNQRTNNGTDYDTDNFIETDYPIFFPNFYSKRYKNILKIYTESQKIINKCLKFIKYLLL